MAYALGSTGHLALIGSMMDNRTFKEYLAGLRTFIFDLERVFTDNRVQLVTEVYLGIPDKLRSFEQLRASSDLDPATTAYMGDDIPDLHVMARVAFPCCLGDAAKEVKAICAFISRSAGGRGCARDLPEQVLKVQGRWLTTRSYMW